MSNDRWPDDVGIKAIEFVFPMQFVDQANLEEFDGVPTGKYTIGLGQKEMSFCSDREDINSICLTALSALMERNRLRYADIGRVDVGTETIIDKSKSVKTVLMDLFEESGNFNVEGLDTTNACYGGTAALFNALAWVESSAWDGRLAVVVAGDIAVYAKGNARPTGGAGAVAMLIGPNAPLVVERGLRSTYMKNVYDFYKPDLTSEYPIVDGKLSIECYLSALDNCYRLYGEKTNDPEFALHRLDAFVFHSPYCKLVQKSSARLLLNDFVRCADKRKHFHDLAHMNVSLKDSYGDRDVEKVFIERGRKLFETMTKPSLLLASRVGNMYTASVYSCLISYLVSTPLKELPGKKIGVFSYGSGLASSMYSLAIKGGTHLDTLVGNILPVLEKLNSRKKVTPETFSAILEQRAQFLHCPLPSVPQGSTEDMFAGTWYLEKIDEKYRRTYSRKL